MSPERGPRAGGASGGRGSGRREASRDRTDKVVVAVSGIRKRSPDVLQGQPGKFLDDLLVGHACGRPPEDVVNRGAHPPNARPAAALARLNGDDRAVVHPTSSTSAIGGGDAKGGKTEKSFPAVAGRWSALSGTAGSEQAKTSGSAEYDELLPDLALLCRQLAKASLQSICEVLGITRVKTLSIVGVVRPNPICFEDTTRWSGADGLPTGGFGAVQ